MSEIKSNLYFFSDTTVTQMCTYPHSNLQLLGKICNHQLVTGVWLLLGEISCRGPKMSLCLFWSLAHNWMEEANLSTNTHSANHKRRMLEKVKVSPFEMCCSGKEQLSIWVFFYASSVRRQAIVFHASSVGHGKLLPSTTVATSLQSVSPNNYQKSLTREIIFFPSNQRLPGARQPVCRPVSVRPYQTHAQTSSLN